MQRIARTAVRRAHRDAIIAADAATHHCAPYVAARPACAGVRRFASAASSSSATTTEDDAAASTSGAFARPLIGASFVPPPTLLHARSSPVASTPLSSRAHLLSLNPTASSNPCELTFLGTASGRSSLTRNVSSLALRMGRGKRLSLFDCGEGTTRQLRKATHLRLSNLSTVFITHLHGDHVWGLPSLLCESSLLKRNDEGPLPAVDAAAPERTLHVFGPQGLAEFVKGSLRATESWVGRPVLFHELLRNHINVATMPAAPPDVVYHQARDISQFAFQVYEDSNITVAVAPLKHRHLSCWGYAIREKIPNAHDAAGGSSGSSSSSSGRLIVVLGDTSDSSEMLPLARGADVIVHEATYLAAEESRGFPHLKGHSSAGMAGRFGRDCGAQHLILTHFSQRYVDLPPGAPAAEISEATRPHREQAAAEFGGGDSAAGNDAATAGPSSSSAAPSALDRVHAAQDLQIFHVAPRKPHRPDRKTKPEETEDTHTRAEAPVPPTASAAPTPSTTASAAASASAPSAPVADRTVSATVKHATRPSSSPQAGPSRRSPPQPVKLR